mmetsp:Transcript_31409/g.97178  ORF Transcript_31409/g.97178 Transcript_31409/m.97178 type:complete len:599 (-) Transcript_31409:2517-4313(-)
MRMIALEADNISGSPRKDSIENKEQYPVKIVKLPGALEKRLTNKPFDSSKPAHSQVESCLETLLGLPFFPELCALPSYLEWNYGEKFHEEMDRYLQSEVLRDPGLKTTYDRAALCWYTKSGTIIYMTEELQDLHLKKVSKLLSLKNINPETGKLYYPRLERANPTNPRYKSYARLTEEQAITWSKMLGSAFYQWYTGGESQIQRRGATDILQSLKSTGSTCGILHYILEKIRMGSDVDQKIHAKQIERHINRKMRIGSLNNIHQYANTLQQHFETYHQANGMIVSDDMKHLMDHKYWEIIKFIIDEAEESQIDFSSLDKLTTHFLRLLCSLGTLLDSEDNTFDKELKIRKSDITNLSDISKLLNKLASRSSIRETATPSEWLFSHDEAGTGETALPVRRVGAPGASSFDDDQSALNKPRDRRPGPPSQRERGAPPLGARGARSAPFPGVDIRSETKYVKKTSDITQQNINTYTPEILIRALCRDTYRNGQAVAPDDPELHNKILYHLARLKLVQKPRPSAFVTGCHPDDIDAEPPESASPPSASPPAPAEDAKAEEPTVEMIERDALAEHFCHALQLDRVPEGMTPELMQKCLAGDFH